MKKVFHQKTINHRSNTLMVLDVLMATMLGMVAFFVVSKNSLTMPVYDHAWWLMPLSTALLLNITNLSVGLYDVKLRDSNIGLYRRCLVSGAMTFCIFEILVFNAFQKLEIAPIAFALFLLATVSVIFISRFMANTFEMFGITKKRVIVIGSGERASIIEKRMRREADRRGFKLVGFIKLNTDKEDQLRNENILEIGSLDNLQAYVAENRIDEIVIAPDERRGSLPLESLFDCKMTGVVVKDILDFIEEETGQVAVNLIYPS
ncbi:hypothetical protein PN838_16320 [Psychrosphaera sp. G1-22]|uniref:Sugar transferase n=3 Tax=Psychrosphaera TaxID=907197 RepID=A0ABT5FEW2_9GAMM|nr:hypothetical protein [Psychrosphaera sp. G1-22]MDC2890048.1 hypothetical protein [Psychrosphaera sp. G1-22]